MVIKILLIDNIPKPICVRSAYDSLARWNRVSINCQDEIGKVHTVILRRVGFLKERVRIEQSFADQAESVDRFQCKKFGGLYACFNLQERLMVTASNRESVLFFLTAFERNALR